MRLRTRITGTAMAAIFSAAVIMSCGNAGVSEAVVSETTAAEAVAEVRQAAVDAESTEEAAEETSSEALPPFEYTGEDPVENAVCDYILADIAQFFDIDGGMVSIPLPVIVDEDLEDPEDIRVWGNFQISNNSLSGTTLMEESGGSFPGCIHFRETEDGLVPVFADRVTDGAGYSEDVHRIFGEEPGREEAFYESYTRQKAEKNEMIRMYREKSGLDITAFQEYGWESDPVVEYDELDYQVQYPDLAGTFDDRVSGRAHLTITDSPYAGVYEFEILWGDGASAAVVWNFTAWYAPEVNRLEYINAVRQYVTYDAQGKEDVEIQYERGSGSVSINEDGTLSWFDENGTQTAPCVFVRST